ncbi:hypothetical protein RJT34_09495 [Clitoria ternatea]|uniref:Uncharacterized protein n=1 Tax=Clitoria ternatea TaxID=43366 RepID=A0AAN9K7U3_CLITE
MYCTSKSWAVTVIGVPLKIAITIPQIHQVKTPFNRRIYFLGLVKPRFDQPNFVTKQAPNPSLQISPPLYPYLLFFPLITEKEGS